MAESNGRSIELNHMFAPPPGVVDAIQMQDVNAAFTAPDDVDETESEIEIAISNATVGDPSVSPPASMTVVSQTVSLSADGTSSTTVVVEFPDVDGMFDVEVRQTRS